MHKKFITFPKPLLVLLILVVLACNLPFLGGGPLAVQITSPAAGAAIAVDQPSTIACSAQDPSGSGVARVELFVNGTSMATQQASGGAQSSFNTSFTWQPTSEGQTQLMVIAYRADGTASSPATITVDVVGMTSESTGVIAVTQPSANTSETEAPETVAPESYIQGEVTIKSNIRIRPGPLCQIIGVGEKGDVINLMEYSKDNLWFKTDHLGPDKIGWIYIESVKILGNEEDIPHGNETGCAGCGDHVCASNENCSTCSQDCGQCCGNGACQPEFGENCSTCTADCGQCCGNGACDFGETCTTCPKDCGPCPPVCGNGIVETGEQCESNSQCRVTQACVNCKCVNHCGNKVCEPGLGESCTTCTIDCGPC
jgi:hypothetical protein